MQDETKINVDLMKAVGKIFQQNYLPEQFKKDAKDKLYSEYSELDWIAAFTTAFYDLTNLLTKNDKSVIGLLNYEYQFCVIMSLCITYLESHGYDLEKRLNLYKSFREKPSKATYHEHYLPKR